jgi:two-component system response regulator AtoC
MQFFLPAQTAEHDAILQTLERTQCNRRRAARLLDISYRALLYKIKDAGFGPARASRDQRQDRPA